MTSSSSSAPYKTEEEVDAAKVIIKTKLAEWDDIREKEIQEDWDRKEKLRLDDLAKREREKEDESRKTILLLIQQQQLHADAQRAKEIQDQDTKRAQEFQQLKAQLSNPTITVNPVAATAGSRASSTRLPQRQIRHFKGDIMEWTPFWETFNAAISTSSLTAVQQFYYLKEYLKGEARLLVENLELTDANYQIAIDQLQATYGKMMY